MRYLAQTLDDCTYLLAVIGEAERDGADRLLAHVAALEADAADRVILDLTDMSFLDSSALASIAGAWLNLRGREVPATLVVPAASQTHRMLAVAGMLDRLTVVETRSDALALH
jgi:anti-anti-sigma factor